ncbi:T9SS type A sorting domain-containing protein [Aquimarina sp. W85]|uniref:T9SS type A sorting domain-containing protein n=1 Tax=Aquimarina rhodophyticola TaxID=3342246 RepID=UPI00366FDDD3
MHVSLLSSKSNVCVFLLLLVGYTAVAQTLKTKADPQSTPRGHQLYKQSKLYDSNTGAIEGAPRAVGDRALDRIEYEFNRLKDPNTGQIPSEIRTLELDFSKNIRTGDDLKKSAATKSSKGVQFSYWKNRGPYNVGGRTRALAIDATNENVILAGGVSGGLWRSENSGQTWKKVTTSRQSPSITCIVQDPRPGKQRIWYYGSGERSGNSASSGGAFYTGTGVYKSINGGRTWKLLSATDDGDIRAIAPFDLINSIAVNPTNGDLYVATFNGVFRSKDEGNSFEEVLPGGFDSTTEVAITSGGKIYVTIASNGIPNAGFFTSTDGDTWAAITPPELVGSLGRTVMGIDPMHENFVYFFAQNIAGGTPAFLYKYDALNQGTEEAWTDLTQNLPLTIGGSVGNLNLQGGYNMVIKVHPSNCNYVFVGGTNLYRSETGFTTPAELPSWIGGYSPLNNISTYTDQHPDQHNLVFYPSNPNRALSGNDGGVFITEDITAENPGVEPVDWTSLNNGYITTQPYAVSFDPEANSDDLLAGFQDNGTWFTSSTSGIEPWIEDFSGDGSFNAIADAGLTRYVSSQRGNIYRFNFDEAGTFISFSRVLPAGANNLAFITPFILDPNNDNVMYLPDGNRIWRNNDLDALPLFSNAPATVNWVDLPKTDTPVGTTITSLAISKYPIANRLYYGTNSGDIYRLDNANIDDQEPVNISAGKGLPLGYVNDIDVDPSNSDRVVVTFSNYRIQSIFLTEDAGDTWINISGNLEENTDGSGNGPSVRSTAFFGSSTGFGASLQRLFAATSTGLYYTNRINGERTRWIKESFVIGNAVADQVKVRKDGFVAVAAHGSGLFSARFPLVANPLPESELSVAYLLEDLVISENSEPTTINIAGLFEQSSGDAITVEVTNSNPELVTVLLKGDLLTITYASDSLGKAAIGLIASSGNEQVSEGFTINITETAVYEQIEPAISSLPSQFFTDFGGLAQSVDDFNVPDGYVWNIEKILAYGSANNAPLLTSATVVIYENNAGTPGEEIYNSGELTPTSEATDTNLTLELPEALSLTTGSYWLSVYTNLSFTPEETQWFWSSQAGGVGLEPQFKDDLNLFGTGATDWTPVSIALEREPLDQVFQIFGSVTSTALLPENNENASETLAVINSEMTPLVYPNPSSDRFIFNFKPLKIKRKISLEIFDISGRSVFVNDNIDATKPIEWNAGARPAGFYYVKIKGQSINSNFKIIKK